MVQTKKKKIERDVEILEKKMEKKYIERERQREIGDSRYAQLKNKKHFLIESTKQKKPKKDRRIVKKRFSLTFLIPGGTT